MPKSASGTKLNDSFAPLGDIKGILVRFQASHGVIIIAFFDIRESIRAQRQIPSQSLPGLEEACLDARFVNTEQLEAVSRCVLIQLSLRRIDRDPLLSPHQLSDHWKIFLHQRD